MHNETRKLVDSNSPPETLIYKVISPKEKSVMEFVFDSRYFLQINISKYTKRTKSNRITL